MRGPTGNDAIPAVKDRIAAMSPNSAVMVGIMFIATSSACLADAKLCGRRLQGLRSLRERHDVKSDAKDLHSSSRGAARLPFDTYARAPGPTGNARAGAGSRASLAREVNRLATRAHSDEIHQTFEPDFLVARGKGRGLVRAPVC